MNEYQVEQGPIMVRGQIVLGYTLGVRVDGLDVVVFAPTRDDAIAFARRLGDDVVLYGENRQVRCVLAGEEQVSR